MNLTDEIACFKKAAELRCPDFRWNEKAAMPEFSVPFCGEWQMIPMDGEEQINRYAAAVCAEFFASRINEDVEARGEITDDNHMIGAARAFGVKYGTPR